MKKKALFIITKATWGGAQRYVFDLATHLPQSEFEVSVAHGEKGRLAEKLAESGIPTRRFPSLGRDVAVISDVKSFFEIRACIRELKPDAVHLNSSKAAALGALAARAAGARRIVFTAHGWPFNEKRNAFARAAMYLASWFTAALSTSVIVVSKSDETQGKRMWLVKNKIQYIPIGIEPQEFLAREDAERALGNYGFTKPIFPSAVTIAELTKNKGIRYGVEAVAELKRRGVDVEYFIIGEGEERAALARLASERGLAGRVHFCGFIPDAAMYLKAFDVFLLPSIKEGTPYVLLEAAAANLPIITTIVVNPDMINHHKNIRAVSPADPGAIADAILESMRREIEEGTSPSPPRFPLADMIAQTIALYR